MLIYVDLFEKMVLKQSKENLTDTKTQTIKLRLGKDQLNMVRDIFLKKKGHYNCMIGSIYRIKKLQWITVGKVNCLSFRHDPIIKLCQIFSAYFQVVLRYGRNKDFSILLSEGTLCITPGSLEYKRTIPHSSTRPQAATALPKPKLASSVPDQIKELTATLSAL